MLKVLDSSEIGDLRTSTRALASNRESAVLGLVVSVPVGVVRVIIGAIVVMLFFIVCAEGRELRCREGLVIQSRLSEMLVKA